MANPRTLQRVLCLYGDLTPFTVAFMPSRNHSRLYGDLHAFMATLAPHSGLCASVQRETLLPFTKSRDILQLTVTSLRL